VSSRRFPIRYSTPGRLMGLLGLGPSRSFVEISAERVVVQMSWGFHLSAPRTAVTGADIDPRPALSRGVHGWRGRWLVNGAGAPFAVIHLDPPQRAHVCGVPVTVTDVAVSVDDPGQVVDALA
jgi:hypothetical protein